MKKMILTLVALAGISLGAQAQLENWSITLPPDSSPIITGGASPIYTPVVYDQPVVYNAPVQYYAPVVYYAPVIYNTAPMPPPQPVVCAQPDCSPYDYSSVQVIRFGAHQGYSHGYHFNARR